MRTLQAIASVTLMVMAVLIAVITHANAIAG